MADIGANPKTTAKALKVSQRSVYRWLKRGYAPFAVQVALFWLTSYGHSQINAEVARNAQIFAGLARSQKSYILELEAKLSAL